MQQVDLAPTLLDVLGIRPPPECAGVSYRRVIEDERVRIRRIAYAETGIWFIETGEQFFQRQRIRYPDVSVLCRLAGVENQVVLRDEYRDLIDIAKHRTVFDEQYKLIYIPTREGARYELYRRGDTRFNNLYSPDHPQARRLKRYFNELMDRYEAAQIIHGIYIPHAREVRNGS
jgi:arylsulfatase A-like enzyme